MKYCPNCKQKYESASAQFCNNCGTQLIEKENAESNTNEVKVCPSCGKTISDDQQYCAFCGSKIEPTGNNAETQVHTKSQKGRLGIIVLVIVLVVLLGVVGVIGYKVYNAYFDGRPSKNPDTTLSSNIEESATEDLSSETSANNETISTTETNSTAEPSQSVETTIPDSPSTTTVPETTALDPLSSVPSELQQYAEKLVPEGRTYKITLQEDDWYINYRSEPVYISINETNNNILGKMKHGTEIYVEYIYNGTWAVFLKDGRYVFSSIYSSNDPTSGRLMEAE